ncbi:rod shape-determining protein MreD [Geobacter sp. OR-1]|uniref:rod shape-determining protein MreD n=1 Tax=Geobacter sp. OR-1 TaxID=1266765 RepID=UPI000543190D|nr:rod shape-determining protein MreD [Geobacter sp. OR-1]GAM08169.1 rod shape-determining protein MreD [Geobacter sp. OR-1]
MTNIVRTAIAFFVAFVFQITIFPAVLADPFKPNLLLVAVVWIGLTVSSLWGAALVYLFGLIQDTVSGLYLGLNGISYLITFIVLHNIAHRLYADSRYLMTLSVFITTLACGITQLILLALFSSAGGIIGTLLYSLIPQGLVNALAASLCFSLIGKQDKEELG